MLYHNSGNVHITGTSEDRFVNTPRRPFSKLRSVSRRWRIKCSIFNQFIVQSRPSHSYHSYFIAHNKRYRPVPSSPTDAESHDHLPQVGRYTQVTRTATDPHMTLVTGLWLRLSIFWRRPMMNCFRVYVPARLRNTAFSTSKAANGVRR